MNRLLGRSPFTDYLQSHHPADAVFAPQAYEWLVQFLRARKLNLDEKAATIFKNVTVQREFSTWARGTYEHGTALEQPAPYCGVGVQPERWWESHFCPYFEQSKPWEDLQQDVEE